MNAREQPAPRQHPLVFRRIGRDRPHVAGCIVAVENLLQPHPVVNGAGLLNYRARQNCYIVDRLFAAAELRLGGESSKKSALCAPIGGRSE